MIYLIAYFAALVPFGVIDAIWLSLMGPALYKPTLGDVLLPEIRLGPAIAFYLIFPIGLVVFAVLPGLRSGSRSEVGFDPDGARAGNAVRGPGLCHLRPDQFRDAA
jgi:uncharacterized membrane protein